jgi:hypothetical protein
MNREDIEEWMANPSEGSEAITGVQFRQLCELALRNMRAGFSVPQGEPVAYVWDEAAYPDGDVRGRGWHEAMGRHHPNHPAMTRNVVQLYAAPPADGVDELAALQSELTEQCRLNGMGQEREARLMAQLQEAERKIKRICRCEFSAGGVLKQSCEYHSKREEVAERNALERAAKACYDDESGRDGGGYYADIIRALIKEGRE